MKIDKITPAHQLAMREVAVLRAVHLIERGSVTDIAMQLDQGGTPSRVPTVYATVTDLIGKGLLARCGLAVPSGGRPRSIYRLSRLGYEALRVMGEIAEALKTQPQTEIEPAVNA